MSVLNQILKDLRSLATSESQRFDSDGERPSDGRSLVRVALSSDAFHILVLTRLREAVRGARIPFVNHLLRVLTTVLYSIEIGNEAKLGTGVDFVHSLGTVVGGTSTIGDHVVFLGNNTVGNAKNNGYPCIEDDVTVGAGARILGPVRVGKGAVIGANAVVLIDVPAGGTATGIPARVAHNHAPAGVTNAAIRDAQRVSEPS